MDPDFGMNIVECGFVKDIAIDAQAGAVSFRLELTTPACPIKGEFEREALAVVNALPWVSSVRPSPPPAQRRTCGAVAPSPEVTSPPVYLVHRRDLPRDLST
jgi:Iron-sulfur cluster assembly protein